MKYTITREQITVHDNGKVVTVPRDAVNFKDLREALLDEDFSRAREKLFIKKSFEAMALEHPGFAMVNGVLSYKGSPVQGEFFNALVSAVRDGLEDPSRYFKFYAKLMQNPSWRSVNQVWGFLVNKGIPILPDGDFLAYKGVRSDYLDCHSGTLSNKPGAHLEVPRNQISDDPNEACHFGLHVGALSYAQGFAKGKVVICKVDPADVVCVPYDHSMQKMRVCQYTVVGDWTSENLRHLALVHPDPRQALKPEALDVRVWVGSQDLEPSSDPSDASEPSETVVIPSVPAPVPEDEDDEGDDEGDEEAEYGDGGGAGEEDDEEEDDEEEDDEEVPPPVVLKKAEELPVTPEPKDPQQADVKTPRVLLENYNLGWLRSFAATRLGISGASKLPGGRAALLQRIEEAQRKLP